jgi:hypothetical protein
MYVNTKMITVKTVPGIRAWRMGKRSGRGSSSMIYFIRCKNLSNVRMYPHPAQQ